MLAKLFSVRMAGFILTQLSQSVPFPRYFKWLMSNQYKNILRLSMIDQTLLSGLLQRFGLDLEITSDGETIPGSFWGDEEAGLIGHRLLARLDTPVHSILHEAGHFICMDATRRASLDTNAQGDYDEENAVCYLQILLADEIPESGRRRMLRDMDSWGYTFRLGSALAWFEQDAEDARQWLIDHDLITPSGKPSYRLREL